MATLAAESDLPEADKPKDRDDADLIGRLLTQFDIVSSPQIAQRASSLQARRFVDIPGAQWEGEWGEQFENSIKPEVDKITKGLDKLIGDYRDNRIMVDFRAADDKASEKTAETMDGIYRADSYHFKAQQAFDNAFDEASKGGFGAWRLTTDYADPYDKDSDAQRINPGMVINDADQCVFFDPDSKLYDKSDAKFCYILTAYTVEGFRKVWGDDGLTSWPDNQWKLYYEWYAPDIVKVAEYYEVEDREEDLLVFTHRITDDEQRWWKDELESGDISNLRAQGYKMATRKVRRKRVHKYILSGGEVLKDCGFIAGTEIPVVPVYYKRSYTDNQERWRGYVQKRMDIQRVLNAKFGSLSEVDATTPFEVPILTPEQVQGHENAWAAGNIERHPYRLVNPVTNPDGTQTTLGPIGTLSPPQVPPVSGLLLQMALSEFGDEDQNADEIKANTSHEAMELAATRIDAKSGIPLDNMRQSMQRGGEIYAAMMRDVYCEPGRKVDTLSPDGSDGKATLHQPAINDNGAYEIINDFAQGKYKVISDVTEATSTKKDKTVRACLSGAEVATGAGDQELSRAFIYTAAANMDGEGMSDLQDWIRQRMLQLGLAKPTPEEAQALAQAAQNQQPDPTAQALQAQAADLMASAQLKGAQAEKAKADTGQSVAATILKLAQASELGAPVEAPPVDDGLESASKIMALHHQQAQTEAVRSDTENKRIRTGAEIEAMRRANDNKAAA